MEKHILIRGGETVDAHGRRREDILLSDGIISRIAADIVPARDTEIIDATGKVICCGFADLHVHLREPGYTHKETIATGSRAAAAGGYTTVCAMPNLNPVPDTEEHLKEEQDAIDRDAVIEVLPYCSITLGRRGREVVDIHALRGKCVAFSDDGSGVQDQTVMEEAMRLAAREECIIAAHCEDNSLLNGGYIHDGEYAGKHGHRGICSRSEWGPIAKDLASSERTGCRYHVCHVSTRESVRLIREAKQRGVRVTCETAPHYLVFTDADLEEDGRWKMNPPLRSASDREALIEGIKDGTIDAVATDHAPHTAEEKSRGLALSTMGIVGLETAFPVLYTRLVKTGTITLERLVDLLSSSPRRIFGLGGGLKEGERADLTIIDLNEQYNIDSTSFLSMGHSTPFDGMKVEGRIVRTLKDGKTVYLKD